MSYNLNEKLRKFTPYEPITGEYHARMDANESFIAPGLETLQGIIEKISAADLNRYPDPYAGGVCRLFAEYLGVPAENVVAGNGSDEIISIIAASFFCKGDKILTFSPDFSMYGFYAQIYELTHISLQKNEDMLFDIDETCDFINTRGIRGVFLSNPCNPTSAGIPSCDILKLAERTDALVVIDEAYMEFFGDSVTGRLFDYDNLIVLKTCSKALGLAGIRLGFAVSGKVIIDGIKTAKSPYNVNLLTQLAGEAALSAPAEIKENIKRIIASRDDLYGRIKSLEGNNPFVGRVYPTRTNFVFFKSDNGGAVAAEMKKNGIAVRHMGDFLRITAGTENENNDVIRILSNMR